MTRADLTLTILSGLIASGTGMADPVDSFRRAQQAADEILESLRPRRLKFSEGLVREVLAASKGLSISEAARHLARRTGVSVEAARSWLRRHAGAGWSTQ